MSLSRILISFASCALSTSVALATPLIIAKHGISSDPASLLTCQDGSLNTLCFYQDDFGNFPVGQQVTSFIDTSTYKSELDSTAGNQNGDLIIRSSNVTSTFGRLGTSNETSIREGVTMDINWASSALDGIDPNSLQIAAIEILGVDHGFIQYSRSGLPGDADFVQSRGGYSRSLSVDGAGPDQNPNFGVLPWNPPQPADSFELTNPFDITFTFSQPVTLSLAGNVGSLTAAVALDTLVFTDLFGSALEQSSWNGDFSATSAITGIRVLDASGDDLTSAFTFFDSNGASLFNNDAPEPGTFYSLALGLIAFAGAARVRVALRQYF